MLSSIDLIALPIGCFHSATLTPIRYGRCSKKMTNIAPAAGRLCCYISYSLTISLLKSRSQVRRFPIELTNIKESQQTVVALSKTKNPRGQSQLDAVKIDLMCERCAYFAVNSGVSTQPAYWVLAMSLGVLNLFGEDPGFRQSLGAIEQRMHNICVNLFVTHPPTT